MGTNKKLTYMITNLFIQSILYRSYIELYREKRIHMSIIGPLERILQNQLTESENKIRFLSELVKHLETQMAIAKDIIKENKSSISNYKKKYQFLKSQVDNINDSLENQNVYSIPNKSIISNTGLLEDKLNDYKNIKVGHIDHDDDDEISTEDECSPILTPHPSKDMKIPPTPRKTKKRRLMTFEKE